MIKVNTQLIREHINDLIQLEDYVPISFVEFDKQHERVEFLRSKNLLTTIREMDELVRQKCNHYNDPVKAYDSVLIEWLDCHPEFEGIIAEESLSDYQNMKNNNDYIGFIEFLDLIILPSEKILRRERLTIEGVSIKDDSKIQLPNFNKIDEIYDKYPNTLLADYLSYLV